jgi:hypothetical protein
MPQSSNSTPIEIELSTALPSQRWVLIANPTLLSRMIDARNMDIAFFTCYKYSKNGFRNVTQLWIIMRRKHFIITTRCNIDPKCLMTPYTSNNRSFIVNYSDRYLHQETITTSFIESTGNYVIASSILKARGFDVSGGYAAMAKS